jgi:hypothetical protein
VEGALKQNVRILGELQQSFATLKSNQMQIEDRLISASERLQKQVNQLEERQRVLAEMVRDLKDNGKTKK